MVDFARAALVALSISVASASLSSPLLAQNSRDLDNAQSDVRAFTGTVGDGPERFTVTVPAGTALQIDAAAGPNSQLDPYLRIRDAFTDEVLSENDDGGEGLSARSFIFAETERRIEIEVSGEGAIGDERQRGAFELSLRPTDWRPTPPRKLANGERVTGELFPGEQHLFEIDAAARELVTVTMRSASGSSIDSMLELRRGNGADGELLAEDDDSAGSLNARIRHTVNRAGTYTIVARGYGSSSGEYVVQIGNPGPPEPLVTQELSLGEVTSGEFGQGAGSSGEDVRQAVYRLDDAAKNALRENPAPLVVRLRRLDDESGLDPVVDVGLETPLGLAVLATDDDSGGELDAELTLDVSSAAAEGDWLDRLRFVGRSISDSEGLYTIEVSVAGR